jgi:hypothetical protein
MRHYFKAPVMAALLTSFVFTACDKNDDKEEPAEKTNTEKISLSAWKYDKLMIDQNGDGTGDFPLDSEIEACEKDNLITFSANGTGTVDEGPSKCDPQTPQTFGFTWSFKENETIINFPTSVVAGVEGDVKLVSLSESSMVISRTEDFGVPLGVLTVILTLKH